MCLSVCPSVWGWKAVLRLSAVPSNLITSRQNLLTNLGSLSLVMLFGTPCRRTMWLKKAWATAAAVVSAVSEIRWVYLLNLSTTTITLLPFVAGFSGNSVTKSILMSCQGYFGIYRGYNLPGCLPERGLILWQTSHYCTNYFTWYSSLGNQYLDLILAMVLLMPKWPVWSWSSEMRVSTTELGTTSWSCLVYNNSPL